MKTLELNKRVFTDFLGYTSQRAVSLLIGAVVGVFVARYLGRGGLGLLSYAQSVFALLGPFALLGMESILVREFSTEPDWKPILASAVGRQLPVATLSAIAGLLIITTSRGFNTDALLVALMMVPLPLLNLRVSARAYLEATGRVRRIVATSIVATICGALSKVVAILVGAPVWVFALAAVIEGSVAAIGFLSGLNVRLRISSLRRRVRRSVTSVLVSESWPLLLSGLAVTAYMQADIVMLGLISGDLETGVYVAAARLSEVWYFLPMSALPAVRPRLARMFAAGNLNRYTTAIQRFMTVAFVASAVVAAIVFLTSDLLVDLIYGSEFSDSAPVLRIHIFAAPFVFLGVAANQWFIDRALTRIVMIRSVAGAVTNVLLNLVLIPRFGGTGAAVATLVSYSLSGVILNAVSPRTRELFWLQLRALRLAWTPVPNKQQNEQSR